MEASTLITLANSFWSYGAAVSDADLPGRVSPRPIAAILVGLSRDGRPIPFDGAQRLSRGREQPEPDQPPDGRSNRQDATVGATFKTQNLTMQLYRGGLANSLELIFAQVSTLNARIDLVAIKADLLRSSVALIRALGGGWNRRQLPTDEQIQPFDTFQYTKLGKPLPVGGIDVNADNNSIHNDLTKRSVP